MSEPDTYGSYGEFGAHRRRVLTEDSRERELPLSPRLRSLRISATLFLLIGVVCLAVFLLGILTSGPTL